MGGVQTGQMGRAVRGLTLDLIQRANNKRHQDAVEGLAETEEQFVIEISGRAEEFPIWNSVEVKFGTAFINIVAGRDSTLSRPHFVYGSVVSRGGPVGILACVTKWNISEQDETLGCNLAIGAVATDLGRKFQGELHARFQGYGAPVDSYGDISSEID